MRPHTISDIELDLSLLYRLRGEQMTQAALAREIGMSEGHLSRRLARARRHEAEVRRREAQSNDPNELDRFDYPFMEIVNGSEMPRGEDYVHLEMGTASRDCGKVHVGGRVRSLTYGVETTDATGPTSYEPDPAGLKGGVG